MEWRIYPNDKRYEVSDSGLVRRIDTQRVRTPSSTPSGYKVIVFSNPGGKHTGRYVHRMVMESFVGPCPKDKEVSHLNGINTDNRLENLKYETRKENVARKVEHKTDYNGHRNPAAKLSKSDVRKIKKESGTLEEIGVRYGVSRATIGRIKQGISWKNLDEE